MFTLEANGSVFERNKKIGVWRIDKDMVVLPYLTKNLTDIITLADIVAGKAMINVKNNKRFKGVIIKTK